MIGIKGISAIFASMAIASFPAHALTQTEESNKAVVMAFYEAAINQKDFDAASAYVDPSYRQHNPRTPDGVGGLKGFINGYLKTSNPRLRASVKRVVVQDDIVVLHVKSEKEPGDPGTAIVDMFRVKNGKIVEHWDVMQPIPEVSANDNSMF